MAKIVLDDINSGYNLSKINSNFQKIEEELNEKVLYRDIPPGEPNQMEEDLDMNGKDVYNVNTISIDENIVYRGSDIGEALAEAATAAERAENAVTLINNSGLSPFTQRGTGAVQRDIHDKVGEFFSVEDYGAEGSTLVDDTSAFQKGIDALDEIGGGVLHATNPYYRIDGVINWKDNVKLLLSPSTVIDTKNNNNSYAFRATGTFGSEIAIAATVTSGDTIVTTVDPHNLGVGDWFLLKSQKPCLHDDAGYAWRLGETTSGTTSPYFAEPLQVKSVDSATQVTVTSKVIFPNYTANNSVETDKSYTISAVSVAADKITVTAHGFSDGDAVRYYQSTTLIGGLTNGSKYYVKTDPLDPTNKVLLATSAANVAAGPYVNLTSTGDGKLTGGRTEATIAKINFMEGVEIEGGIWQKSDNGKSLIRLDVCMRPKINVNKLDLGATEGVGIYTTSCYDGDFKATAVHTADWELGAVDHSAFNSFKDVGGWYNRWVLEEYNGSQGWDQSFVSGGHCTIRPYLKMKSYNSHEDGATTHGACYGGIFDIEAYGPQICGFRNRARFADIKINMIGETTGGTAGLVLSSWGALDVNVHDSIIQNAPLGIDVNPVGVSATAPEETNLTIDNLKLINITSGQAILFRDRTINTSMSNVRIRNIDMRDCYRGIYVGEGWNGVTVDDMDITRMDTSTARYGLEYRPNAAAGRVSNVRGNNIGTGNTLVRLGNITDAGVKAAFNNITAYIDDTTIQLTGTGIRTSYGTCASYIAAGGTWTPTITGLVNSAVTDLGLSWTYSIINDVVTFSGVLRTTAAAAGQCHTLISLVPNTTTAFGVANEASGVGSTSGTSSNRFGAVYADITNEKLLFEWYATGAGEDKTFRVSGQYRVTHY